MKLHRILITVLAMVLMSGLSASPSHAQKPLESLKIGLVDLQAALNKSAAGERSKKILLTSKTQKENELKAKDADLKKDLKELQANIMLSDEARRRKEDELRRRDRELKQEAMEAQRELQQKERKLTESIFIELKTVIEEIGREEKFDLILEQNASQVILFANNKFEVITDKVIERYNKFQGAK